MGCAPEVFAAMRKALDDRPVWAKAALVEFIPVGGRTEEVQVDDISLIDPSPPRVESTLVCFNFFLKVMCAFKAVGFKIDSTRIPPLHPGRAPRAGAVRRCRLTSG